MDNLKCLFDHVSAHASVDFIDACETFRKELLKLVHDPRNARTNFIYSSQKKYVKS